MGAYPVFVVDGEPSPLKSQARIERFFRMSGLDSSELPKPVEGEGEGTPVRQKNRLFTKYVRECTVSMKRLAFRFPLVLPSLDECFVCVNIHGYSRGKSISLCLRRDHGKWFEI